MAHAKSTHAVLAANIIGLEEIPLSLFCEVQAHLQALIDALNTICNSPNFDLMKALTILSGEEIRGVFAKSGGAYVTGRLLKIGFYPLLLRVGIGMDVSSLQVSGSLPALQESSATRRAHLALKKLLNGDGSAGPYLVEENLQRMFISNTLTQDIFSWEHEQTEAQREISLAYEVNNLLTWLCHDDTQVTGLATFIQLAQQWRHRFISEQPLFDDVMRYAERLPPQLRKASLTPTAYGKQGLYSIQSPWPQTSVSSLSWLTDTLRQEKSITSQAVSQRRLAGHVDQITSLDAAWMILHFPDSES